MKTVIKWILSFLLSMVVGLYTTFVLETLWNWFATIAFVAHEIGFWATYGLVLTIGLFTGPSYGKLFLEEQAFERVTFYLEASIPDDKRELVRDQIKEQQESVWYNVFIVNFGTVFGNTVALGIGWFVHAFLV